MDDSMNLGSDSDGSSVQVSPPRKATRTSRAKQVVSKTRRRNAEQGNVKNLPSTRLERGSGNGQPMLKAVFAKKGGGEPNSLDLTFLLDFPGLADIFAEGCLKWLKPQKHLSRINALARLRRFWFTYLTDGSLTELMPLQLDEQIMAGFNSWLHRQLKANGTPLSPNTIRKALGDLRTVLKAVPGSDYWLDIIPAGPRGAERKGEPTEVLQFDQLLMVMAAVEKEVLALRDRWIKGRQLLVQGRQYLHEGQELHRDPRRGSEARSEANLALMLAMLDQRYPGVIPDLAVIKSDDRILGRTVQEVFGNRTVTGYFYASARDLVPPALSIALATAFNSETILKLLWKNIDRNVDRLSNERLGVKFDVTEETEEAGDANKAGLPLTKMTGDKGRAHRQLVRLLDPEASGTDQVSLNLVFDLLIDMTARIRPHVIDPDEYADRVFIFVQKGKTKRPKGFGISSLRSPTETIWHYALRDFIASHNLPDFTLKTIRATLLDYVQIFKRGDLDAARQVGNHSTRVTTWTHYTSNLVKRLLQEATGETLLVRERWLQSDGKLDPRKFREWTDKGCATPGFACLDPFDSPRPNQKPGKLCSSYGECPDCPLSAARPHNPHNVMLYEALRRAIYRSVTRVTAAVWQQRWAPIVVALDSLLARAPSHILNESRKLSVELPDIG